MNALVRQIAVLSVLWAMCELLLPDGKHQHMVRMTASLLVMTALLTTAGGMLNESHPAQTVMTYRVQQTAEDTYQRTALAAVANQMESWCVHLAQRAGYRAEAAVYLAMDGSLDHVELTLKGSGSGLIAPGRLAALMAEKLEVEESRIWLSVEGT